MAEITKIPLAEKSNNVLLTPGLPPLAKADPVEDTKVPPTPAPTIPSEYSRVATSDKCAAEPLNLQDLYHEILRVTKHALDEMTSAPPSSPDFAKFLLKELEACRINFHLHFAYHLVRSRIMSEDAALEVIEEVIKGRRNRWPEACAGGFMVGDEVWDVPGEVGELLGKAREALLMMDFVCGKIVEGWNKWEQAEEEKVEAVNGDDKRQADES
ncbi:hypothetical protein EDC01DRAFT_776910 [Geopyxis carbonaria]|nr:hypothetical protein EDC01DRAFT_776910 [Geopyxis carbonaria]